MEKAEWETHVTYDQIDQVVRIFSTVPKHIRRLRSDERVQILEDGGDWIQAEIKVEDFNVLGGFKRRSGPLTEVQIAARKAAGERLKKAREAKHG